MTYQPRWERGPERASRPSLTLARWSWIAVAVALVIVVALPFVEWGSRHAAETTANQEAPSTIGQGIASSNP
jgi:hypothetical protein